MKHSATKLSNCLIQAEVAYDSLTEVMEIIADHGTTDEISDRVQTLINDLAFYINQILEHSTPEDWTDEEFQWIEDVRLDLSQA